MNVPLWLLIPGAALAFIGFIVVAFIAWMAADDFRLDWRRKRQTETLQPALRVMSNPDLDHPLSAVIKGSKRRRR
ncbi:hypothetical protein ACIBCT_20830 [Streptosporangium sp. NPDC050855]|uniref:hypothetical protein n=1 Tax=Streptosporangium sp. NPDC050855 TaxID=3366194 RepID=UPI0037ADFA99